MGVFFFKRVALVFQDAVQPLCFPQRHLWFPSLSSNTLSPPLVVFLYPRTSQQLSGYWRIFAVSLLERVFGRQSVFLHFLRYSACTFPLVCPFLWSLCSATRPSTVPWRAVSFFLPRTLYARHLEASRIAMHEALPSVESSRCVSISGFTYSHDGFFRHIHSMRSVSGRTLQGLGQLCVSGSAFGLLPWLCRRLVPSTSVWRKRLPLPAWPRSLSWRLGNARSQGLRPSTLLLFSKLCRCPLYLLLVWRLSPALCSW